MTLDIKSLVSGQEYKVLEHVAQLDWTKKIAIALWVSEHTVRHHRKNAYYKLGIKSWWETVSVLLWQGYAYPIFKTGDLDMLTKRELEIVSSLINNCDKTIEITAQELFIARETLVSHIKKITKKLWYTWKLRKMFVIGRWIEQEKKRGEVSMI